MNSKQLYVMICMAIAKENKPNAYNPSFHEMSASVRTQIAYNHQAAEGSNISYATLEFSGIRAKFLCTLIFDGAGEHDTSVHNFSMPRQKLNPQQKALVCLAFMEYMTTSKGGEPLIAADFNFIREKIQFNVNGGVGDLLHEYDEMRNAAFEYVERKTVLAQQKSIAA